MNGSGNQKRIDLLVPKPLVLVFHDLTGERSVPKKHRASPPRRGSGKPTYLRPISDQMLLGLDQSADIAEFEGEIFIGAPFRILAHYLGSMVGHQ